MMGAWLPLPSFFETECETPDVRLHVDGAEVLGFWDDDDRCWRSASDDREVAPTAWAAFQPDDALNPAWLATISTWAATKPEIAEAFVFGSRARGDCRVDSDIDVALRLDPANEMSDTTWVFEGGGWREELSALLPVGLDLWPMADDDEKVGPGVRAHGRLAYQRATI